MRISLCVCAAAICLVLGAPARLPAQFTPTECASISANVLANPHRVDSLRFMYGCPVYRGATFAPLLGNFTLAGDTAVYASIVGYAAAVKESEILDSAMSIAGNSAAPDIARIGAIHVLISYVDLGYSARWVSELGSSLDPNTCTVIMTAHGGREGDIPPTGDYIADVHAKALSIQASGASNMIKHYATCLAFAAKPRKEVGDGPVHSNSFTPSNFSYVKQCDRKFLLRNSSYAAVTVLLTWGWSTSDQRLFNLPPRIDGASYSEVTWTVPGNNASAQVHLGVLPTPAPMMIQTPNNTPC